MRELSYHGACPLHGITPERCCKGWDPQGYNRLGRNPPPQPFLRPALDKVKAKPPTRPSR